MDYSKLLPIKRRLKDDRLILFFGSGFSTNLGLPTWRGLTLMICDNLIKDGNNEFKDIKASIENGVLDNSEVIKRFERKEKDVLDSLKKIINSNFSVNKLKLHYKAWKITPKIITTNYDKAFEASNPTVEPIVYTNTFEVADMLKQNSFLFKLHGTISDVGKCIFFEKNYKELYCGQTGAIEKIKALIQDNSFLFIGFSMDDPYVANLFKNIYEVFRGYSSDHYILTTTPASFEEYGINEIQLTDFSEIEGVFDALLEEKRTKTNITESLLDKKDRRVFLRRRGRLFLGKSTKFKNLIDHLISEKINKIINNSEIQDTIRNFRSPYSKVFADAVYHERFGKVEQVIEILNSIPLSGEAENTRLLYRAVALEKLDKIYDAISCIIDVLRRTTKKNIFRTAQFNLNVCYEKLEQYDKVNFLDFINEDKIILAGNERLCDKALCMHLIYCIKADREFFYDQQLKKLLKAEKSNSPSGYIKTLVASSYNKSRLLSDQQIEEIIQSLELLRTNAAIGVIAAIAKYIKKDEQKTIIKQYIYNRRKSFRGEISMSLKKHIELISNYIPIYDKK